MKYEMKRSISKNSIWVSWKTTYNSSLGHVASQVVKVYCEEHYYYDYYYD